jgi:hypothetical protein
MRSLRYPTGCEVRPCCLNGPADRVSALAWTDRADLDSLWFEFCRPPFARLIAETDFAGRRAE